jgi:hypothetical protein
LHQSIVDGDICRNDKPGEFIMATSARPRIQTVRSPKPKAKSAVAKAEKDLLDRIMVSVSATLETMSDEEQERAVAGAERAVAHLR